MSEQNAVLALQNAWNGAVNASAELTNVATSVAALPATTLVSELDLAGYRRVILGHANAAMALQGLVEELQRKLDEGKQA